MKAEDLTPPHLRCAIGTCPSLHKLRDGRLLVVGKEAGIVDVPPGCLSSFDMFTEAAIVIDPALLDTFVAEKVKTLREALKSSYISLFMDGRNEHGTHLLEAGGGTSILCIDEVMKALHPKDNTAEDIFKEAEAAGHAAGHSIVTRWRYIDGECQYWEFEAIDHLLTSVMHGTAAEQQANFDALTPSSPGGEG